MFQPVSYISGELGRSGPCRERMRSGPASPAVSLRCPPESRWDKIPMRLALVPARDAVATSWSSLELQCLFLKCDRRICLMGLLGQLGSWVEPGVTSWGGKKEGFRGCRDGGQRGHLWVHRPSRHWQGGCHSLQLTGGRDACGQAGGSPSCSQLPSSAREAPSRQPLWPGEVCPT